MKSRQPLVYAALATFLCAGPAWADQWHEGHEHWKKHAKHHEDQDDVCRLDWRRSTTGPVSCRPVGRKRCSLFQLSSNSNWWCFRRNTDAASSMGTPWSITRTRRSSSTLRRCLDGNQASIDPRVAGESSQRGERPASAALKRPSYDAGALRFTALSVRGGDSAVLECRSASTQTAGRPQTSHRARAAPS